MALDPAAFADLLCSYCIEAKPRQQVLVRSTTLAAPLLLELAPWPGPDAELELS